MEDSRDEDSEKIIDSFLELKIHFRFSLLKWLKNILTKNGFDKQISFGKIEDIGIKNTEHFAKHSYLI